MQISCLSLLYTKNDEKIPIFKMLLMSYLARRSQGASRAMAHQVRIHVLEKIVLFEISLRIFRIGLF